MQLNVIHLATSQDSFTIVKYQQDYTQIYSQLQRFSAAEVQLFNLEQADVLPWNYTINLIPSLKSRRQISRQIEQFAKVEAQQYFYTADSLHLTLLGLIPLRIKPQQLVEIVKELQALDFRFQLYGVNSSEKCASFTAYPLQFDLQKLRRQIRTQLGLKIDESKHYRPPYEKLGWINFMRYYQIPSQKLVNYLQSLGQKNFGEIEIEKIVLLKNSSRTVDPRKSELLYQVKK